MRIQAPATLFLALLAALAALAAAPAAHAQCPPDPCTEAGKSLWLGDLNNDGFVNDDDILFFTRCLLGDGVGQAPAYCPVADFNFDGEVDNDDLNYLNRIVEMARNPAIRKLPKSQLNEVRVRKPETQTNPAIPQSRYVEIRTPTGAATSSPTVPPAENPAPTVNQVLLGDPATIRRFGKGWYYMKICRSVGAANPTDQISGTIAVVESLEDMAWVADVLDTRSRGLSLMADATFTGPVAAGVPVGVAPFIFSAPTSLAIPGTVAGRTFLPETNTNVTHVIVFRDPSGSRALPAVGQRVNTPSAIDPAQVCDLAWTVAGAIPILPPWDAIVDCVTIVKGIDNTNFGCVFGGSTSFNIGPVGPVGSTYAPPHVYRCRTAGTLTRGVNAVATDSDSPFVRNATCVTTIQGCGELGSNGGTRSCFETQIGPGCSDADCCGAVCQIDPSCCTTEWDAACAAQAQTTCVQCGTNPASCYVAHSTPSCSDANCCKAVCAIDPSCCTTGWSEPCATLAAQTCLSCGTVGIGACFEVHELPYCDDSVCCGTVCNLDPTCCTVTWDQACVNLADLRCVGCGGPTTGDCCIAHPTPYCNDGTCCTAICAMDPYCCDTVWDTSCAQLALANPSCANLSCACGQPTAGSCFAVHAAPGCADGFCCQLVCQRDPYCCYVNWDRACRDIALDTCSTNAACLDLNTGLPVLGSCFVAHLTPGCDQPGCCSQVCATAAFAYCCNTLWDEACAIRASDVCDSCGDPLSGSCFAEHGAANCADSNCCTTVCGFDPFCCSAAWDGLCVTLAQAHCPAPIAYCGGANTRSCWIPNYTPGCNNPACCLKICSDIDPFCCEVRWDAVCAREAGFVCVPQGFVVTIGREGCLSTHASKGCANADCSRAVCSVDPSCCTTAWDARCVLIATAVCVAPDSCPGTGDCFAIGGSPGCNDSACCNAVCQADPACCDGAWDQPCVTLARQLCKAPLLSDWPCPCRGECTSAHDNPGCLDSTCCKVVCNIDPSCCVEIWDGNCASFARQFCCGPAGCGSGCNGPCLVPHEEPYCSDPYCCDAVCRTDPLCCAASWDSLCVAGALVRCASGCGLQDAGNCFAVHDLPGCRDGRCCGKVCEIDPSCCTTGWDSVCVDSATSTPLAAFCKKPVCGAFNAGEACQPHDGPACNNLPCCENVCAQDSYCCDIAWDSNCVDLARKVPECGCSYDCGDPCAGSCCRAHANGRCDNAECCALVCAQDAYCCDIEWDSVCASMARSQCSDPDQACPAPPCGSDLLPSCCVASPLPNCSDENCCRALCLVDNFCCEVQWDVTCAQQARSEEFRAACQCDDGGCGSTTAGSCFSIHSTPFCNDLGCCQTVCAFEPTCCDAGWDANCVTIAEFFCGGMFTDMVDAFRGGRSNMESARGLPPAGWVPPRVRAMQRQKQELPAKMPRTDRVPVPAQPGPRAGTGSASSAADGAQQAGGTVGASVAPAGNGKLAPQGKQAPVGK